MTRDQTTREHVAVEITTSQKSLEQGGSINIAIKNQSASDVWIVTDKWFVWHVSKRSILLSFARARQRTDVEVFGYFLPEVEKLSPLGVRQDVLYLDWPLALNSIWNAERSVWPEAGTYSLRLEYGFGRTPFPAAQAKMMSSENVENIILQWQVSAVSNSVPIVVPQEGETP
jgi:hypothetical protein